MKNALELYVHLPFCVKKCAYCDFLSFPAEREAQRAYVDALKREILACAEQSAVSDYEVHTVFFGGGTPSLLPGEWIAAVLELLRSSFSFSADPEISLEANPGTVTREKLRQYRDAGFNRISFGCQSMSDRELKLLGRIHTRREFLESWQMAAEAGFPNRNIDLMSALPGQTLQSWEQTLRETAALSPEHISAYSLILEEGTPFYERQETLSLPDEETERLMYERTGEILAEYGYRQYEISNYAKPGFACRHNMGYWTGTEYLGLGLGSSSLLQGVRFRNTAELSRYLTHSGEPEQIREEREVLTMADQMAEFMILGLRLTEGIRAADYETRFGEPVEVRYRGVLEKYRRLGLLQTGDGRIRLTRRGLSLSNTVMADFL